MTKCKDCMYYNEKAGTGLFPSGKCHGYFGKGKLLVKATDYCSRFAKGSFEDYLEMSRIADAILLEEIMRSY